MSQKEPASVKVVVSVVSGLILAVLLFIAHRFFPPVNRWFYDIFLSAFNWLMTSHVISGWGIIVLCSCGIYTVICIIINASKLIAPDAPNPRDFTELRFSEILWRWRYGYNGDVLILESFCSQQGCDMQIFPSSGVFLSPGNYASDYNCERCGHRVCIKDSKQNIENRVILEIERLHRNGEWKDYLQKKKK